MGWHAGMGGMSSGREEHVRILERKRSSQLEIEDVPKSTAIKLHALAISFCIPFSGLFPLVVMDGYGSEYSPFDYGVAAVISAIGLAVIFGICVHGARNLGESKVTQIKPAPPV